MHDDLAEGSTVVVVSGEQSSVGRRVGDSHVAARNAWLGRMVTSGKEHELDLQWGVSVM